MAGGLGADRWKTGLTLGACMPELPEVETIRRRLIQGEAGFPSLLGACISHAQVYWEKTIAQPSASAFERTVAGQCISAIERRGKFLIFKLTQTHLLVHLRMSGDLLLQPNSEGLPSHARWALIFDQGFQLVFQDARKFGRTWLLDNPMQVLGSLGPEPLDESFSEHDFFQHLKNHRRQIKPLLLDQHFLAGLGNIYTDESLHMAGIHPQSISSTLTFDQAQRLFYSIRAVLQKAIDHNGTSLDWVYRGGNFQNHFTVYQRAGEPCFRCGSPIIRMKLTQRGTYYCPECQPLSASMSRSGGKDDST